MPEQGPPPIEVGYLIHGPLTDAQRDLAERAVSALQAHLQEAASGFAWCWSRYDAIQQGPALTADVMDLLEQGLRRVTSESLDFLFIVTGHALLGGEGEPLRAAGSSAGGLGVISLNGLPANATPCVQRVMLQLLGHMAGLAGSALGADGLCPDQAEGGRDGMGSIDGSHRVALVEALHRVADLRVEERGVRGGVAFYLASVSENWRQVLHGLVRARPWLMPLRLSRLTTAAASTLFVLMMTAEVWEIGMAQSGMAVGTLSMLVLASTAVYILLRQRLLQAVRPGRLTEQVAVMRIALALAVLSGVLSTYGLLYLVSLGAAMLYPETLVARWAALGAARTTWGDYAVFAGFVSAIGVIIGSLGASFERQGHLKELALVDAKIKPRD